MYNHMISSATWNNERRINGECVVFEKLMGAYVFQIAREKSWEYLITDIKRCH